MAKTFEVPIVFIGQTRIDIPDKIAGEELTEDQQSVIASKLATAFALAESKPDNESVDSAANDIENLIGADIDDEEFFELIQIDSAMGGRWESFYGRADNGSRGS